VEALVDVTAAEPRAASLADKKSRLRLRVDCAPPVTLARRCAAQAAALNIAWSRACAASFSAASKRSTTSFQP
jgi:hypothetical protein